MNQFTILYFMYIYTRCKQRVATAGQQFFVVVDELIIPGIRQLARAAPLPSPSKSR